MTNGCPTFFSLPVLASYLQMVLELECLAALPTLELSQVRPVVVIGHVPLELGQVGKLLGAHGAGL